MANNKQSHVDRVREATAKALEGSKDWGEHVAQRHSRHAALVFDALRIEQLAGIRDALESLDAKAGAVIASAVDTDG
jgi:hypothetical protein